MSEKERLFVPRAEGKKPGGGGSWYKKQGENNSSSTQAIHDHREVKKVHSQKRGAYSIDTRRRRKLGTK